MPTLKEIKGRIGSVQNTLKITSAMKLVSSAKLHKAQAAIENMRPYEAQLQRILAAVQGGAVLEPRSEATQGVWGIRPPASETIQAKASACADATENAFLPPSEEATDGTFVKSAKRFSVMTDSDRPSPAVLVVAIASNSSLCGGFNANAIAKVKELLKTYPKATVYSVGRKMADAMRKAGYPSPADYSALSEHPAYGPADGLASQLMEEVEEGRASTVFLVYNHFVSAARQVPTVEVLVSSAGENAFSSANNIADATENAFSPAKNGTVSVISNEDYILEPSAKEIRKRLFPKTIKLRLYATLLDSAAAEHAARTVAMQTATDNGEDLLDELTLQYNKGRQQKITSEILDLASGQQKQ